MKRLIWIGKASPHDDNVYIFFDPWVSSPQRSSFQEIPTMPSWTTWFQILPTRSVFQLCTLTEKDHRSRAKAKHVSTISHADTQSRQSRDWLLQTIVYIYFESYAWVFTAPGVHLNKQGHQCWYLVAVSLNKSYHEWHLMIQWHSKLLFTFGGCHKTNNYYNELTGPEETTYQNYLNKFFWQYFGVTEKVCNVNMTTRLHQKDAFTFFFTSAK